MKKTHPLVAAAARLLLLPYSAVVLRLTLIGRPVEERRHAFRPFYEIRGLLTSAYPEFYANQIAGNLAMLLPLGILLPCAFAPMRRFYRTAAAALLVSLSIETAQYLTGRGLCETDDVLHNTVGACVGYAIVWLVYLRRLNNNQEMR